MCVCQVKTMNKITDILSLEKEDMENLLEWHPKINFQGMETHQKEYLDKLKSLLCSKPLTDSLTRTCWKLYAQIFILNR